jgi:hypothetical protein
MQVVLSPQLTPLIGLMIDWFDDGTQSQVFLMCKTSRERSNISSILASDAAWDRHR